MGTAASRNGGGSSGQAAAAAATAGAPPPQQQQQQQHPRTFPATSVPLGADGRPLGAVDGDDAAVDLVDDGDDDGSGATRGGGGGVGPLGALRAGYAALVDAIIRPPRARYSVDDLGPVFFSFRGRWHERVDFTLTNPRGETLQVSRWGAVAGGSGCDGGGDDTPPPHVPVPAVVYLHGNSSCRLGALEALETLLALGVAVVAFDASGSGLSGGEFVTLGHRERDDLAAVVEHLRARRDCSTIGLWGRSMGASTALLHVHRDPSIAALVLDSPFADLKQLALELVDAGRSEAGLRVPSLLVSGALRMVRSSVLKRAGFDIYELRPIAYAPSSFVPALFVAAEGDTFVRPHHAAQLFAAYGSDWKNCITVEGDHNTPRPGFMHDSAAIFLRQALQVPEVLPLELPLSPPADATTARSSGPYHASLAAAWSAAAASSAGGGGGGGSGEGGGAHHRRLSLAAATVGRLSGGHPLATLSEDEMVQQALLASLMLQRAGVELGGDGGGNGGDGDGRDGAEDAAALEAVLAATETSAAPAAAAVDGAATCNT